MPLSNKPLSRSGARRGRRGRRRGNRLTWLALGVIGATLAGGYWLFSGNEPEPVTAEQRDPSADVRTSGDEEDARENADAEPGQASVPDQPLDSGDPMASIDLDIPAGDALPVSTPDDRKQSPRSADADEQAEDSSTGEQQVDEPRTARRAQPAEDPGASARRPALNGNQAYTEQMQQGMQKIAAGEYVDGRAILSQLLLTDDHQLRPADARTIRDTLNSVNRELVFGGQTEQSDDIIDFYEVQSGDTLGRIGREHHVPYGLLERLNNMQAHQLQADQSIRVIQGPIHARVIKSQYRMDTFVEDEDGNPVFLHSFRVGLGEDDSTPVGRWVATSGGKVVNPDWRNPRTGEYYSSDDPGNPIGNYWIGKTGLDEDNQHKTGYGIHGTIEPESIGAQESMGCIRLNDDDIEIVFDMLEGGESIVEVQN